MYLNFFFTFYDFKIYTLCQHIFILDLHLFFNTVLFIGHIIFFKDGNYEQR